MSLNYPISTPSNCAAGNPASALRFGSTPPAGRASESGRPGVRLVRQGFACVLTAMALLAPAALAAENLATNLDSALLALAVTDKFPDGGYVVVLPRADLQVVDASEAGAIKDWLSMPGVATNRAIRSLVDQLFERNKTSGTRQAVRLPFGSCATNGYVVDHDGKYIKYLENDGGSWARLYAENPKVRGLVSLSLPAYDEKTGLVVILKATARHGLEGWGELILYRYENNKLIKLKRVPLWKA